MSDEQDEVEYDPENDPEFAALLKRKEAMNEAFNAAPTREAKLAVLKLHMSDDSAEEAYGIMMGLAHGDKVDISGGNFGSPRKS